MSQARVIQYQSEELDQYIDYVRFEQVYVENVAPNLLIEENNLINYTRSRAFSRLDSA